MSKARKMFVMGGSLCGWTLRGPKASSKTMSMIIWQTSAGMRSICSWNSLRAAAARQASSPEPAFDCWPNGLYPRPTAAPVVLFGRWSWELAIALNVLSLDLEVALAVRFVCSMARTSGGFIPESWLNTLCSSLE